MSDALAPTPVIQARTASAMNSPVVRPDGLRHAAQDERALNQGRAAREGCAQDRSPVRPNAATDRLKAGAGAKD